MRDPKHDDPRARFFELSSEMLCIANFEGRFETLNPSWERTLGWTLADLTSRPFVDFVHPDDLDRTLREASALASGEAATVGFVNRYRCKDGTWRWLKWTTTVAPQERRYYSVASDITSLMRMKESLEGKLEDIQRWQDEPGDKVGVERTKDRLRRLRAELETVRAHLRDEVTPARPR